MTNENQTPASLGMLFVYWFYARCRGMVLPRWFFIGWGFHALGGAFLLLAPGNAARLSFGDGGRRCRPPFLGGAFRRHSGTGKRLLMIHADS